MHYGKMCAASAALLRKSTSVLLLLVVLSALSCRTQKTNLKQTTATQTNEQTIHTEQTRTDISRTAGCRTEDRSVSSEDTERTTEVTDWSVPDSLGRQYPVRTTKTRTSTRRGQRNDIQTAVTDSQNTQTNQSIQTTTTRDEDTQTKTDSKVKTQWTTPSWVIWTILGIIAALTIIILIALKRYRII